MQINLLGRFTLDALKHDAIAMGASTLMVLMAGFVVVFLTYKKLWKWFWNEWITTLDPKKIGTMYLFVVGLMLLKGVIDAVMMRVEQALSCGSNMGYLGADHFQQLFTAHGTVMIFFVGMGIVFGMINLVVPLQIGARDVAFPFLNAVSFWLFFMGFMLINVSLMVGEFSAAGWTAYPPLSGIKYSPGVGVDYWIWSLQVAGIGSLFGGINFFVTIIKMRCPGMSYMKMPLFTWTAFATMVLVIFAFPILTVTITLLALDRVLGMHFFTSDFGGNPMMYVNLIWAWGHPEVYILILPAFGIFSEVVSTFSEKRLFGYKSMVWAIAAITILSFIVWLHHFFTMGASVNVNAFFGAMTMLVAIPTGVKIFNWLFTMVKGRVHLTSPMLWFLGFVFIFTIGGMAGMLLSIAPVDYQTHNSLFLIAHFHSVIIGGVAFGFFAGFTYWFPKYFGFKLHEGLGKCAFWCWFVGFFIAFLPLYVLGLMGVTRRLSHYDASTGWQPFFVVAAIGAGIIAVGIGFQLLQFIISIKQRDQNRDTTGDPWNGRTLEWSTKSPPPLYNFAILPVVHDIDAFWQEKKKGVCQTNNKEYEDILMPKNTPMGFVISVFAFIFAFAIIWYIWWLAILGILGVVVSAVVHLSEEESEYVIPAKEIERMEK
jgi:cytochrome o ubiquinol oxidase subunit 1